MHALLIACSIVFCDEFSDCAVDFFQDVEERYASVRSSAYVGAQDKAAFNGSVRFSSQALCGIGELAYHTCPLSWQGSCVSCAVCAGLWYALVAVRLAV